ncbi:MAG: hypothetical protein AAF658_09455, partial [Myxococcota bacterium]
PTLCETGNIVEVAWPERLYPAEVVRDLDATGMCLVAYVGEERRWTERVAPERVYGTQSGSGPALCQRGEQVLIDWLGTHWYAAKVRAAIDTDGRCPVHYVDYDASWDESVPLERVRPSGAGDSAPLRNRAAQPSG